MKSNLNFNKSAKINDSGDGMLAGPFYKEAIKLTKKLNGLSLFGFLDPLKDYAQIELENLFLEKLPVAVEDFEKTKERFKSFETAIYPEIEAMFIEYPVNRQGLFLVETGAGDLIKKRVFNNLHEALIFNIHLRKYNENTFNKRKEYFAKIGKTLNYPLTNSLTYLMLNSEVEKERLDYLSSLE